MDPPRQSTGSAIIQTSKPSLSSEVTGPGHIFMTGQSDAKDSVCACADTRDSATPLGKRVQANLGAKNHAVIMPDGQSGCQKILCQEGKQLMG